MKRVTAQEIGDIGESIALSLAAKNRNWIARKQDKDFGIDIEMELVDRQVVTGQFVKIQVKGMDQYEIIDGKIKCRLKNDFLKYCNECRIPVILVLIDIHRDIGYFIWVQEYLHMYELNLTKTKTNYVFVPSTNDFVEGLNQKIKNIALRLNYTQLQLDLKACLETSFLIGDEDIYEKLMNLSLGVAKTNALEVNKIIKDLIVLGNHAWATEPGNKKAQILYSLCKQIGNKFSTTNIEEMVTRGSTYSRVGIIALGILYETFPNYLKSLNLPTLFDNYPDPRISYYCRLREKYLGKSSFAIVGDKQTSFKIGRLDIFDSDREEVYLKWPNRGDSVILDYVYWK